MILYSLFHLISGESITGFSISKYVFSHWGRRFDYVRADPSMAIWESIEAMDKTGMDFIEKKEQLTTFSKNIADHSYLVHFH